MENNTDETSPMECSSNGIQRSGSSGSAPLLQRIDSVVHDTELVTKMLDVKDFNAIYNRIKELRSQRNRTDVVTNEILEGRLPSIEDKDGDLITDVEAVKVLVLEKFPNANVSLDKVYDLLDANKARDDRVSYVRDHIVNEINSGKVQPADVKDEDVEKFLQNEDELVHDLEQVIAKYPSVDPHQAFKLLITKFINSANRVADVAQYLLKEDLMKDTDTVSALFPNQDKNEIYAYLEAHYHNSNRVQMVTEEIMQRERNQQGTVSSADKPTLKPQPSTSRKRPLLSQTSSASKPKMLRKYSKFGSFGKKKFYKEPFPELQREKEVDLLRAVFPDCDPDYLFSKLEEMVGDPERVQHLSDEMFENTDYPKLKDRLRRQQRAWRLKQLQELDMDDFLKMFPVPSSTFEKDSITVSGEYKKHARVQLLNEFPLLSEEFITKQLDIHNGHYCTTKIGIQDKQRFAEEYRNEEEDPPDQPCSKHYHELKEHTLDTPRDPAELPELLDEYFYKELLYSRNREEINSCHTERHEAHMAKIEKAQEAGAVSNCDVCYGDQIQEDLVVCDDDENHSYCKDCLRNHIKECMTRTMVVFPCMGHACPYFYPLSIVQEMLPSDQFSLLLKRIQEDEIRRADIKDLVSCPFCSFATIMSDPNDKVLKCLNPECFKESCRLCQEPNHVPLRCEEMTKAGASSMKTFIETKMMEAMIRVCWRCNKRFFKTEGCNMMACVCGACMCYLCGKPVRGYDHFDDDNDKKCNLYSEIMEVHVKEMKEAIDKARAEWIKMHPEDESSYYDLHEFLKETSKHRDSDDGEEKEEEAGLWGDEREVGLLQEHYEDIDDDVEEIEMDEGVVPADEFAEAVKRFNDLHGLVESSDEENKDDEENEEEEEEATEQPEQGTSTQSEDQGTSAEPKEGTASQSEDQKTETQPEDQGTSAEPKEGTASQSEDQKTETQPGDGDQGSSAEPKEGTASQSEDQKTETQPGDGDQGTSAEPKEGTSTQPGDQGTSAEPKERTASHPGDQGSSAEPKEGTATQIGDQGTGTQPSDNSQ